MARVTDLKQVQRQREMGWRQVTPPRMRSSPVQGQLAPRKLGRRQGASSCPRGPARSTETGWGHAALNITTPPPAAPLF